jgi:CheY-like chemotaxis protein
MKHSLSSIKTLATAQRLLRNTSDETARIEKVLGLIGRTLDLDRVGLFKLNADATFLEPLLCWNDEGIARRTAAPVGVDALEEFTRGTTKALGVPLFDGPRLVGMLLLETGEPHDSFDTEAREFVRYAARMLVPHLDVALKAPEPPKLSRPGARNASADPEDLHILIVEDDRANLFMIEKFIERFGAIPHSVVNGEDAVQICKERKFDVILMDLTMPRLDGFDATREIVTGENLNRDTPIIAVTADVTEGIERRCRKIGMQHYIAKPIRRDTIIRALTDLTNKKPKNN